MVYPNNSLFPSPLSKEYAIRAGQPYQHFGRCLAFEKDTLDSAHAPPRLPMLDFRTHKSSSLTLSFRPRDARSTQTKKVSEKTERIPWSPRIDDIDIDRQ